MIFVYLIKKMRGIELIRKTMELEECGRVPWVPFVGVHGAYIIGENSEQFLKSKDMIIRGVSEAIAAYNPDGIPVVFDLQLEAEAMGCRVIWAEQNPPSVIGHPLSEGKELKDLKVPELADGRVGIVMEAASELRRRFPEIALYGLVTGPFTLGLHLLGTDIFMSMFLDEKSVHELMKFCTKVAKRMTDFYCDAGCDVIALVDPMVSQIDTEQFVQFVAPYSTKIFEYIKEKGCLSSFFVCGDAQHNISAMCNCKPDNISVDENISLEFVKETSLSKRVSFGGNLKLTTTLLLGEVIDCEKDAVECMNIGGSKGFILSPGCDLPYKTKAENLKAIADIICDPYRQEIINTILAGEKQTLQDSNEENHSSGDNSLVFAGAGDKSILRIDVITLDSSSCAPCQYMMDAVLRAAGNFTAKVEVKEHKIKNREGLEMMKSLSVTKIPTICIDGRPVFSSKIPPVEKIRQKIEEALNRDK